MARRRYRGPISPLTVRVDGADRQVRRGDHVDVSDAQAATLDRAPHLWEPADDEQPQVDVTRLTVDDALLWVDGDPQRARIALDQEQRRTGGGRSTLTRQLQQTVGEE